MNKPPIESRRCLRCGYRWYPHGPKDPVTCPNPDCRSPYWNIPRKEDLAK
jgi:hypothetical protein